MWLESSQSDYDHGRESPGDGCQRRGKGNSIASCDSFDRSVCDLCLDKGLGKGVGSCHACCQNRCDICQRRGKGISIASCNACDRSICQSCHDRGRGICDRCQQHFDRDACGQSPCDSCQLHGSGLDSCDACGRSLYEPCNRKGKDIGCGKGQSKHFASCKPCGIVVCCSCSANGNVHSAVSHLDACFLELLSHLLLDEEDLQELLTRGLDRDSVMAAGYKSWPGGKLEVPHIKSWLGRDILTERITLPPGLLIPARNGKGKIVALQVKPRQGGDTLQPKYKWVSRCGSVKLPSGEVPMFVCRGLGSLHTMALIEGGLKAHVFAHLSGMHVIGASGGQFWQSPELLQSEIDKRITREVVLFPDAGAVSNPSILTEYFRTFNLLQRFELQVSVAWWGQYDKAADLDADDYLNGNEGMEVGEIPRLDVRSFWKLVPEDLKVKLLHGKNADMFLQVMDWAF